MPSRADLCSFLYLLHINVILYGPLNNKQRSWYALSYILSASRLMLSVKTHLTKDTDHCMRLVILESKPPFLSLLLKFGRAILSVLTRAVVLEALRVRAAWRHKLSLFWPQTRCRQVA